MEHRHDDLERRLARKFRMRIDRHAAAVVDDGQPVAGIEHDLDRSEEHTSELQSLMRISYAVFCLKKKIILQLTSHHHHRYIKEQNTTHIHISYHQNCILL